MYSPRKLTSEFVIKVSHTIFFFSHSPFYLTPIVEVHTHACNKFTYILDLLTEKNVNNLICILSDILKRRLIEEFGV